MLLVGDIVLLSQYGLSVTNCVVQLNEETVRIKKQSDGQFVISGRLLTYASQAAQTANAAPLVTEDFQRTITAQQMTADPVALVYAQVAKRYTNVTSI